MFIHPTFWVVLLTCLAVCAVLVLTREWHGKHTLDHDLTGAQKLHTHPVPRVGGLGIALGLLMGVVFQWPSGSELFKVAGLLLLASVPVFAAGITEDITKRVGVRARLLAAFASAALAIWLIDARLSMVHTPLLDAAMALPLVAGLFTVFAVGGMTNATNIIDGLNGLAAGSVALMLGGLAALAYMAHDTVVMQLCLWGAAAMLGFLVLNYPFGKIFMGDGGAYLAGFWLAECAVLLLARNPSVNTWSVLLVCLYPFWETVYSMYRRRAQGGSATGEPDQTHMHHLVFKTLSRHSLTCAHPSWVKHGLTSLVIWAMVALSQWAAVTWARGTGMTLLAIGALAWLYCSLYTIKAGRLEMVDSEAVLQR